MADKKSWIEEIKEQKLIRDQAKEWQAAARDAQNYNTMLGQQDKILDDLDRRHKANLDWHTKKGASQEKLNQLTDDYNKKVARMSTFTDAATTGNQKFARSLHISDLSWRSVTEAIGNAILKVGLWVIATTAVMDTLRKMQEMVQLWKDLEITLERIGITTSTFGDRLFAYFTQASEVAIEMGMPIQQVMNGMDLALRATASLTDETERSATAVTLLRDAAILGNIAGMQFSQSIDLLVGSLRQSGMELDQGVKLLDKWVAVQKTAAVSVNDLSQGFAIMADAGRAAGLSVDQINGLIAALSETVTLGPVETGNAIRALMSTLYNEGSIKILQKYGVAVRDTNGEVRSFWTVMQELSAMKQAGVLDDSVWLEIAKAAGAGQRRYAQFLALLNNFDKAQTVSAVSANAQGEALSANQRIVDTLTNSFDQFTAAQNQLFYTFGDKSGIIEDMTEGLHTLTGAIQSLTNANTMLFKTIKIIAQLTAALIALKVASVAMSRVPALQNAAIWANLYGQQAIGYVKQAPKMPIAGLFGMGRGPWGAGTPGQVIHPAGLAPEQNFISGGQYWTKPAYAPPIAATPSPLVMPMPTGLETPPQANIPAGYKMSPQGMLVPESKLVMPQTLVTPTTAPGVLQTPSIPAGYTMGAGGVLIPSAAAAATQMPGTYQQPIVPPIASAPWYSAATPPKGVAPVIPPIVNAPWYSAATAPAVSQPTGLTPERLTRGQVASASWGALGARVSGTAKSWASTASKAMQTPMRGMGLAFGTMAAGTISKELYGSNWAGVGGGIGAGVGGYLGGPAGMIVGGVLGGFVGQAIADTFVSEGDRIQRVFDKINEEFGLNIDKLARYYEDAARQTTEGLQELAKAAAPSQPEQLWADQQGIMDKLFTPSIAKYSSPLGGVGDFAMRNLWQNNWGLAAVGGPLAVGAKYGLKAFGIEYDPNKATGKEQWEEGMGAYDDILDAWRSGVVSADEFTDAIVKVNGSTKDGYVNWAALTDMQKAWIVVNHMSKEGSTQMQQAAKDQAAAIKQLYDETKRLTEIENQFTISQERIKEIMETRGLQAWENQAVSDLTGRQQTLTIDDYNSWYQSIQGMAYGYASHIASIEAVNSAISDMGKTIATVPQDKWLLIQRFDPDFAESIVAAATSVNDLTEKERIFTQVTFQSIASLAELPNATIGQLDTVRAKLQEIAEQEGDPERLDDYKVALAQIEQYYADIAEKAKFVNVLEQSTAAAQNYQPSANIRLVDEDQLERFNELLQGGRLDYYTNLAQALGKKETEYLTLVDPDTGRKIEFLDENTLALQMLSQEVSENTEAVKQLEVQYNLPGWYQAPNRFWAMKETGGGGGFGPEHDLWDVWVDFLKNVDLDKSNEIGDGTSWISTITSTNPLPVEVMNNEGFLPTANNNISSEDMDNWLNDTWTTPSNEWQGVPYVYPTPTPEQVQALDPSTLTEVADSSEELSSSVSLLGGAVGWLLNTISNFSNLPFAAEEQQLLGSFATGGTIPETGPYYMHKGESVIPGDAMQQTNSVLQQANNIATISQGYLSNINLGIASLRSEIKALRVDLANMVSDRTGSQTAFSRVTTANHFGVNSLGVRR